ncbi:hypothetical protein FQZ97_1083640 [compost metagenome]
MLTPWLEISDGGSGFLVVAERSLDARSTVDGLCERLWANRVGCDLRPEIDALETGPIGSTLAHRFHQIRARVYPRGQPSPDQPTPACSRISQVLYTMSPLIVAGVLAWVLTKGFSPP